MSWKTEIWVAKKSVSKNRFFGQKGDTKNDHFLTKKWSFLTSSEGQKGMKNRVRFFETGFEPFFDRFSTQKNVIFGPPFWWKVVMSQNRHQHVPGIDRNCPKLSKKWSLCDTMVSQKWPLFGHLSGHHITGESTMYGVNNWSKSDTEKVSQKPLPDHFLDTILDTPNPLPQYSMPNTIGIVPIPPNRVSRRGPESAPKVVKKWWFWVTFWTPFWTPYYRREYHVWCQ